MTDASSVRTAIEAVIEPDLKLSIGAIDGLKEFAFDAGVATAVVAQAFPGSPSSDELGHAISDAVRALGGVDDLDLSFTALSEEERSTIAAGIRGPQADQRAVRITAPGSRTRVIGIASGKGGVGKSSVTTNLAIALTREGRSVGIIDADVWGFSIPKMIGAQAAPNVFADLLIPSRAHGVAVISMDYFVQPDQAVIWRGPMLHKAIEQFLVDVHWGDLDFLLVDMPPGTGDVAISLSQYLPRAEIMVVTTPQPTAQRVAVRAGLMAREVNQDVIGVVENMSWFTGDDGKRYEIFGSGGGADLAAELEVPLLGEIPLVPALREGADRGEPVTITDPDGEVAQAFRDLAATLIATGPRIRTHPELVIS